MSGALKSNRTIAVDTSRASLAAWRVADGGMAATPTVAQVGSHLVGAPSLLGYGRVRTIDRTPCNEVRFDVACVLLRLGTRTVARRWRYGPAEVVADRPGGRGRLNVGIEGGPTVEVSTA